MKFDKPSPFEGMSAPSFASVATVLFCIVLESTMFVMFYAVYTETIGLMNDTYLSELAVIGDAFAYLDPDANPERLMNVKLIKPMCVIKKNRKS